MILLKIHCTIIHPLVSVAAAHSYLHYFFPAVCPVQNIINRAVLALKPHVVPVFLESFTCASGFSLNLIDMSAATVANIEVAPTGVSVKVIEGYDYHFNM